MTLPTVPEPFYAPGWSTTPRRRLDGLALASFVTATIGLGLVGIGLGAAALVRIRRGRTTGRHLAVAGIAIGVVWTVVQAVVVTSLLTQWLATRPLALDVAEPRPVLASRLVTGHCLSRLPPDGEVGRVEVVPCERRHAAEVISQYRFAPDAVWPGQQGADARIARACQLTPAEVAAGVGLVTWAPTARSWDDGDRTGLCVAHRDGGLTGSLLDGSADLG